MDGGKEWEELDNSTLARFFFFIYRRP